MAEASQSWKKTSNTRIVGGETTLDGSNPTAVSTGLSTITGVTLTIATASAPGVGGTLSIYAWKVTRSSDTTLVASTGTETVSYTVVGY